MKKNNILKVIIRAYIFLLLIALFGISNNIFAYQITYNVATKNELGISNDEDWPDLIYRKEVSAYGYNITEYNKVKAGNYSSEYNDRNGYDISNVRSTGWIRNPNWNSSNSFYTNTTSHGTDGSFNRIYEYFHANQNSNYNVDNQSGLSTRYYASYESTVTDNFPAPTLSPRYGIVYNVWGETGLYQGLYNQSTSLGNVNLLNPLNSNDNIVIMNNNWYRFGIKNSVYVSDNVITNDTVEKLWKTFSDTNLDSTGKYLNVYLSSVLRTASSNDTKKSGQSYYNNMDTAYKFWECTVRGKNSGDWAFSPSTTGISWSGTAQAARSALNYYDNIIKIPIENDTYIYVRHIDVTNLNKINAESVKNAPSFKDTKQSGKAIVTSLNDWNIIDSYADQNIEIDNAQYYDESYKRVATDKAWRICNLKYSQGEAGEYPLASSNKYSEYNCIGTVVGKGDTIQLAEASRDATLGGSDNDIRTSFSNVNYDNSADSSTGSIIKSGNATSVIVKANEKYKYIVVDFYYEKQKPQETEIYVRHIDVTNMSVISADKISSTPATFKEDTRAKGEAILTEVGNWDKKAGSINQNQTLQYNQYYYESYLKTANGQTWRICNLKYNEGNAGSYPLATSTKYSKYNCIGAVVGKGETIQIAEINRDEAIGTNLVESMFNVGGGGNIDYENMEQKNAIVKSGNSSSIIIQSNEKNNYIVIDFYYEPKPIENKKIYVRHIDITGQSKLSSNTVDNLVSNNNVLAGRGVAQVNAEQLRIKSQTQVKGYQEIYDLYNSETMEIYKDLSAEYDCVGTNTVSSSTTLTAAKSSLDRVLNGTIKYSSSTNDSVIVNSSTTNSVIYIVDFYYIKKGESGDILNREPVGRLSYYTLNANDNDTFDSTVNNYVTNNNREVVDAIPSNNSLRVSVDNAYTFMLGGINIKEQNRQITYTHEHVITQKYQVSYKDWSSRCSGECNGSYSNKMTGKCTNTYSAPAPCETPGQTGCKETKTCSGTWTATYVTRQYSNSYNIKYIYYIPCEYTYYKVKNMRIYTISKIELQDGYSNDGLPLFDGKTHIINPKEQYTSSFNPTDGQFIQSNNSSSSSTQATMSSVLQYQVNNENGDIDPSTQAKPVGESGVINLYTNKVSHSTAAKLTSITNDGTPTPGKSITANLSVNNDKYSFVDGVTGDSVTITGKDGESHTQTGVKGYVNSYNRDEFDAEKVIDLSKYTSNVSSKSGNTLGFTYDSSKVDKISVETKKPEATKDNYEPSSYTTTVKYFNDDELEIPKLRVNGKRYSYGSIQYDLITDNINLNFDVNNAVYGQHDWSKTKVTGNQGTDFYDTEMNDTETKVVNGDLKSIVWNYGTESSKNDADVVNIFTPVSFSTKVDSSINSSLVNHHTNEIIENQIQKNSRFKILMTTEKHSTYSGLMTTNDYVDAYYIKFDFDVQDIIIDDAQAQASGNTSRKYTYATVEKGTWIGPIYNEYGTTKSNGTVSISAFALADPLYASDVVAQESNNYWVRAVANNAPSAISSDVKSGKINSKFVDKKSNSKANNIYLNDNEIYHYPSYYLQKNITSDSNFVAEATVKTKNISRVYDFKITDIKDVDWKNIFRTSTTTSTNVHSSKAYYSGIKKWNIYTTSGSNVTVTRDASEIGPTKKQILPLGPFKHTTDSYTKAPKLGYRFSFDLKTTGKEENRTVVIEPSFWYISKDGNRYIDSKHIKLFYKNSDNKYLGIENYKLYFVPDDGYRLTFEGTDAAYRFKSPNISKDTLYLGKTNKITLTNNMTEYADNYFVQIWYGEYKLPNSTIAVEVDENENYNINSKLTDGYIGVKFDISVKEGDGSIIKYSNKNTNISSNTNTSQWDYEGYLGFNNAGSEATGLNIRLEKGSFDINEKSQTKYGKSSDVIYNEIKGTVILYDTDLSASSDYN